MKLAIICVIAVVAAVATATDNDCHSFPTCQDCLENNYCGWCSPTGVVFENGTVGARCIDQSLTGWQCDGQYQTAKCIPGYVCDPVNATCVMTAPGQGSTLQECEASCHASTMSPTATPTPPTPPSPPTPTMPPSNYTCDTSSYQCVVSTATNATSQSTCETNCIAPVYSCDNSTYTCKQVPGGTPGSSSEAVCIEMCHVIVPTNNTPSALVAYWRALEVSMDYTPGEWGFNFTDSGVVIYVPNQDTPVTGKVQSYQDEVWITFTSGSSSGDTIKCLYSIGPDMAETESGTLACGSPGGDAPSSIDYAEATEGYTVHQLQKCLAADGTCVFHAPIDTLFDFLKGEGATQDPCNQFSTCATCIGAATGLCGWCSEDVVYSNGNQGYQCAGFFSNGTADQWTCSGTYYKTDCPDYICNDEYQCVHSGGNNGTDMMTCESGCMAPPQSALCNSTTYTCEIVPSNTTGALPLSTCEAQCVYVKPTNSTPPNLIGTWRGLQINLEYTSGEYDLVFDEHTVTFTNPDGESMTANVQQQGANLIFTVTSGADAGKTLKALYQETQAEVVMLLSLALSAPDGDIPTSYSEAMTGTNGMEEYAFMACLSPSCKFTADSKALAAAAGALPIKVLPKAAESVIKTRIIE